VWVNNIDFKRVQTVPVNADFTLHRLLIGRDKFIWLASVYLSVGTPAQIKALFRHLYGFIPSYEWKYLLLAGDFNVNLKLNNLSKNQLLSVLTKQFGLVLENSNQFTSHFGGLDFLLHGSAIKTRLITCNEAPSDHKLLVWEIDFPCPDSRANTKIPNRNFAENATKLAWSMSRNSKDFLRYIQYCKKACPGSVIQTLRRRSYVKPALQTLLESDENCEALDIIRSYFLQFNQNLEDKRFSNLSKEFFRYLRKVFKYDSYNKRDGSIISSILTEDGNILTNPDDVNEQLITTLKELQLDASKPHPKNLMFPQLPVKSKDEMKDILSKLSVNKAIAWDGVTDSIFHKDLIDKTSTIFADL